MYMTGDDMLQNGFSTEGLQKQSRKLWIFLAYCMKRNGKENNREKEDGEND